MKKSLIAFIIASSTLGLSSQALADSDSPEWKKAMRENAKTLKEAAKKTGASVKETAIAIGNAAKEKTDELTEQMRKDAAEAEARRQDEERANPKRKKSSERFFYR